MALKRIFPLLLRHARTTDRNPSPQVPFCKGLRLAACALSTASLFALCGTVHASTLLVSVSGQFDNLPDAATPLWAANAKWALSFDVNNIPVVSNMTTVGFDSQFSHFAYTLNGANVAAAPSFVTFSTTGNGGLFTLFFGPESGFVNGVPVPEFTFLGAQAFTGTTASPTFAAGSFGVSEWTYSDSSTYDDKTAPASVVTLAPVPEPSSALLLGLPLLALGSARVRRFFRLR